MGALDRLMNSLEGKGWTILYALGGLVAVAILFFVYSWWSERRADEARYALGKAIEVAEAPVTTGTPLPNATGPTFPSERERAQRAVEEFRKVQEKFGSPYKELASYFAAVNLVAVDRNQGLGELEALSRGDSDVASRAKFALAQAREADGQYDQAAALYQQLLDGKDNRISDNTLKYRLATVLEKQGKRDAAVDLLFQVVEGARKARGKDGKPLTESAVTRAADDKLQELSPERHAQLPPDPAANPVSPS